MLNVFRIVAIAIMLLALGELAFNLFGMVQSLLPSAEDPAGQQEPVAEVAAELDTTPLSEKVGGFIWQVLSLTTRPLYNFCFGAILFVLVRIAREQAHDLATG